MAPDIAKLLDERDASVFLAIMQKIFEEAIGNKRFFRITATPSHLGEVRDDFSIEQLKESLLDPPNPHSRTSGWTVKPLRPLRRNALGFASPRFDYQFVKFIKNGHLEFWTAVDDNFCWRQDPESFMTHPRLYPYPVVEYPVSFMRLYSALCRILDIDSPIIVQMQYLNINSAILLPYQPESIGFMHPVVEVIPMKSSRLVFEKKIFSSKFQPDRSALEVILDLYYEFGYEREHVPFFDAEGNCNL